MKGLTHFVVGLAAASCFPEAVRSAAAGSPLYFLLGGIAGLIPDTLDFRFARFVAPHDIEVAPDPNRPDPKMIADALALAIGRAAESGLRTRIKLNTVRLSAAYWQRYSVRFDPRERRVRVAFGPVVSTGGRPAAPGQAATPVAAEAALGCPIALGYEAAVSIDAFDGPLFEMTPPGPDGRVHIEFQPWHRRLSHSALGGLILAAAATAAWGRLAGLIAAAAFAMHLALDQVGFMGSALLLPLSRRRFPGLGLMHSGDAFPNFAAVWTACLLVFWNLARAMPEPPLQIHFVQWLVFGVALPLLAARLALRMLRRRPASRPAGRHAMSADPA